MVNSRAAGGSSIADASRPETQMVDASNWMTQVAKDLKPGDSGRFVQLFAQHQRGIHAYICTLVPSRADAEDVMQETSLVLWRKWNEYDPNREFIRWACGIAFLEVLKLRRRTATSRHVFNESLLEQLSADALNECDALQRRQAALTGCLQKLADRDRELVERRYRAKTTARQVAEELGRPASTVYKALARIRESLYHCVERTLAQESHP